MKRLIKCEVFPYFACFGPIFCEEPVYLLDRAPNRAVVLPDAERRAREEPPLPIVCAACGQRITDSSAAIEVAGRHAHTCVNPAGYVYRIRCFRRAPGCAGEGPFVDEHSWFAGYAWQLALCSGCGSQLGWAFAGPDVEPFHGLIADRIREGRS